MTALDLEASDYIEISAMTRQPSATTLASVRTKFQRPHERSKAWRAARISSGLPHVARSSWVFSGTFFAAVMMKVSRSEEHTSELQSRGHLVCRLLLEKKKE